MTAPVTCDSDSEDESLDDDDDVVDPDFEPQIEIMQENYEFPEVEQEEDTVLSSSKNEVEQEEDTVLSSSKNELEQEEDTVLRTSKNEVEQEEDTVLEHQQT